MTVLYRTLTCTVLIPGDPRKRERGRENKCVLKKKKKKKKHFYPQAIQLTVYEREDHWFKMEVGACAARTQICNFEAKAE